MALNENAKKWVAALRSGEFKQGTGCLRSIEDRYCCLGVACELVVQAGLIEPAKVSNNREEYIYGGSRIYPPEGVREWLGLENYSGTFFNGARNTSLAFANDEDKYTFKEIANIIESEPEGLFA